MKPVFTVFAFLICLQIFACNKNKKMPGDINDALNPDSLKLKITVGSHTFHATFFNNATATAFKARLPLTINMSELNGNEKYFDLPNSLPANASNPGTIQAGDLMLYGSGTLVLFYKTFSTSYNYTRLARVDQPARLAEALGSGSTTVTFEAQ